MLWSVRLLVIVLVPLLICLNTAIPAVTDTIPIGQYSVYPTYLFHCSEFYVLVYMDSSLLVDTVGTIKKARAFQNKKAVLSQGGHAMLQ